MNSESKTLVPPLLKISNGLRGPESRPLPPPPDKVSTTLLSLPSETISLDSRPAYHDAESKVSLPLENSGQATCKREEPQLPKPHIQPKQRLMKDVCLNLTYSQCRSIIQSLEPNIEPSQGDVGLIRYFLSGDDCRKLEQCPNLGFT